MRNTGGKYRIADVRSGGNARELRDAAHDGSPGISAVGTLRGVGRNFALTNPAGDESSEGLGMVSGGSPSGPVAWLVEMGEADGQFGILFPEFCRAVNDGGDAAMLMDEEGEKTPDQENEDEGD